MAAAAAPAFVLERSEAVPALIGRHQIFCSSRDWAEPPATSGL
jgi:hypothetical protein